MLIFDYEDGDLIHTVSDNMAVDFDGNLMMNLEPSFPLAQCRKCPCASQHPGQEADH